MFVEREIVEAHDERYVCLQALLTPGSQCARVTAVTVELASIVCL
jgi:hypothetical protein